MVTQGPAAEGARPHTQQGRPPRSALTFLFEVRTVTNVTMFGSMGFSVKLAPGVRVRASKRGIRAGIGPRAMRVHVGSGRTGVSTGFGPFSAFSSGGGRRRSSSRKRSSNAASIATYKRQLAAMNKQKKLADMKALIAEFDAILSVHRGPFPPAEHPAAAWPPVPTIEALYPQHEERALAGVSAFNLRGRKEAKIRARNAAEAHRAQLVAEAVAAHDQEQRNLDTWWAQLAGNEPGVVLEALDDAFEDNETPASAVGVHGDEVAVVVLAPDLNVIPEKWPEFSAAGNPTMKPLSKAKRTGFYNSLVLGQMLVAVRETFAVAPGSQSVRVVLVRRGSRDAYGKDKVDCLAAACFKRAALAGVQWTTASAVTIFNDVSSERLFRQVGVAKELAPLDLRGESDLRALIGEVDLSQLEGE